MNQEEQQDGRRFRRAISAMAMMAVLGYLVAFSQADKGTVHYKAYSQAYAACYAHVLDTGCATNGMQHRARGADASNQASRSLCRR